MMPFARVSFAVFGFLSIPLLAVAQQYPATVAQRDESRVAVVEREGFVENQGVALKPEAEVSEFSLDTPPDLVFYVQTANPGRYWIITTAGVDEYGTKKMQEANGKYASLTIWIAIDDASPSERVVFVPWHDLKEIYTERTGKFDLSGEPQTIKIWLPKGAQLNTLELRPYTPPRIPPPVTAAYEPKIVPPETRPRLWVNSDSLPLIRQRLTQGENAPVWTQYRATAEKPFAFEFTPGVEIKYNTELEQAAVAKAFVYLMEGNTDLGREAVTLIRDYFSVVSFGNWLDIAREIGDAIYSGSLVYDWCYDLMTDEERKSIRASLLYLAQDMEIGWPPFIGGVVNGHGNEMQMSRNLFSMAIALYGDDSVPYQYCSYRVLEELRPMLAYQYQSPRHHQGYGYGSYRFECDMTAAWFLKRMTGREIFHENIKQVPYSWIYQRLPDGAALLDGDGSYEKDRFYRYANLLNFSYSDDPILKGEYLRQFAPASDPMRWLLVNDPDLAAQPDLNVLPLTKDFGTILGSMIARTGWSIGPDSDDIVVEMKGGGKHFGNHQHSDAGSFQIYFRGLQVGDLGIYGFYGTPYDMNFSKRSVSHSMMLVYDPDESFGGPSSRSTIGNDGGTVLHLRGPLTPEQAETEPLHQNGTRLAAAFGPDAMKPVYSFFSVDLVGAYSEKIKEYTRSFCFINRQDESVPALLLIYDNVSVSNPGFKKYWQINTLSTPELTAEGIHLPVERNERKGRISLSMLIPSPADRQTQMLSGSEEVHQVFGVQYTPPIQTLQTRGTRTLFSPQAENERDEFLTVIQMIDEKGTELPVSRLETKAAHVVVAGNHVVGFARTAAPISGEWSLEIPSDREYQMVLTGMAAGKWTVHQSGKEESIEVTEGNTTLFFSGKGTCRLVPSRSQ
ncbi:MAG: hypothetical protein FWC43_10845 [Planctomycetaceae bacterium]|nr:hypothetical protein [Planctomycetaceae bacterium]